MMKSPSGYGEWVQYLIKIAQTVMKISTKLKVFCSFQGKAFEHGIQCSSRKCHVYFTNVTKDGKKKIKI